MGVLTRSKKTLVSTNHIGHAFAGWAFDFC